MPNHNYNRGRAREYQAIVKLKNSGWVCTRSAMSHGPVDIIAARRGRVRLIQVKSGSARITKEELKLLKAWARAFNADAELWSFRERGQLKMTVVLKHTVRRTALPRVRLEAVPQPDSDAPNVSLSNQIPLQTPSLTS